MKKIKATLVCILLVMSLFSACAKEKEEVKTSKNTVMKEAVVEEKLDPEIEKLNRVLMSMTPRCKEAIPNGDPKEFLADLKVVLDAEKTHPQDELSLYVLVDKAHNIGPEGNPVHKVHLEANPYYAINKNNLYLRKDAADSLMNMAKAAREDGVTLTVSSTYRSYERQLEVFDYWVRVDGLEEAERESARAGTSQHQLGTVIDFGSIDDSYAETQECKWLNEHSQEYGWSLSFPMGYEDVTGYKWESWHFRYIGKEACAFQKKWFSDVQQFMLEFIHAWKNA